MTTSMLERLHRRSRREGACLVWVGARNEAGYGRINVCGVNQRVHRMAWIERHGPIPAETPDVLHRCDNPPCWEDTHLFLGTQAHNNQDRDAKGRCRSGANEAARTRCPQGHAYDGMNTYIHRGHRYCRACNAASAQRRRANRSAL